VDKLLASAPRWLQIIILLAHDAGLRRSDAMRFSLQNYDAETRSIRLIQKKTSEPLYVPADEISAEKTAEENHERSTRRPARTTAMQDLEARQIEREKKKGSHGRKRGATTTEKTNRGKTMNADQFNRMFDKSVHLSSKTPTCSGDRCWCGLCHCARCQKARRETSEASK
jgi:integrase